MIFTRPFPGRTLSLSAKPMQLAATHSIIVTRQHHTTVTARMKAATNSATGQASSTYAQSTLSTAFRHVCGPSSRNKTNKTKALRLLQRTKHSAGLSPAASDNELLVNQCYNDQRPHHHGCGQQKYRRSFRRRQARPRSGKKGRDVQV